MPRKLKKPVAGSSNGGSGGGVGGVIKSTSTTNTMTGGTNTASAAASSKDFIDAAASDQKRVYNPRQILRLVVVQKNGTFLVWEWRRAHKRYTWIGCGCSNLLVCGRSYVRFSESVVCAYLWGAVDFMIDALLLVELWPGWWRT